MFVVDTNVLVYAANADCPEHVRCRSLLEEWRYRPLPWFSTWPIFYEFLRVVSHPKVVRRPWPAAQAWSFLEALVAPPGFSLLANTGRHAEIARLTLNELPDISGNLMHDAHTAILMREHGIRRIYTRDQDFHRFPFLEALDPLDEDQPPPTPPAPSAAGEAR